MSRQEMNDSEQIKMYLNIGSQRISVTVPFDRQNMVREVEADTNRLYEKFHKTFPTKPERELFAMMVYRYAWFYSELLRRNAEAETKADECLNALQGVAQESAPDSGTLRKEE